MFRLILIIVVCFVAGILIYAATKPNRFSIVRKLKINADPEKVFAEINDFTRWKLWSPWETKDPAMQRTYSGSAAGIGAIYEWNGDKNLGTGKMEITDSVAGQNIIIKLDFYKPFEAHNVAEFTFTPEGDGTLVTWEMRGPQVFMGKLMCVFMDMDKMVGKDFEAGLSKLKTLTENPD
ncbi:potassium-transporting ATPase subunit F [Cellvibrio zantedeschiae]|uniref:Potassium-transporting ATPase subunit F n=1 Tax=Cellvibrio zantedeschiae TaxID=1237077 RepID=A0ABQ3ATD1_9GAMM|nr:SRPBCC family protein [Cellvibrio zantedeschiae]GGY65304.1 potassium-transporting ATPase subunit F [Cellvibrio zantedeschiae]